MSMGKNLLTKTSLGEPPNEMGNCPFASPLVAPLGMVDLIDQLGHINDFLFIFDDLSQGDYLEFFIEKFRIYWLEENSYRLAMNHFTFWQGNEYQQMRMAIGGPKTKKYSE
jgi:hypothetical protein